MQAIERMRRLLSSLPKSDQPLGEQFIQERNFESLKDLVDSAMYRVNKSLKSDKPKAEYLEVDIPELSKLKSEVDVYLTQLELPEQEDEDYYGGDTEEEY